jgi:hypothetical protein
MKICNAYLEQWILCSYADSPLFFTAVFGFLLATLAVTSFGAPVERRTSNHSCGHAVRNESNTGKPGGRHGLAKMIDVVKCQLAIVITHFKDRRNDKTLNDYYVKVSFRLK